MAGICILIFGSTYACDFYFFYCRSFWRNLYITISFVTNMMGFIATMSPILHIEKYAWMKGVIFAGIGIFNGLSMVHPFILTVFYNQGDDIPWN